MDILSNDYSHIYQYDNGVNKIMIKILEDTPCEGVDVYASVGQFSKTTSKEMLMLFYPNVDKYLYGVIFSAVIDYFKEDLELNYYGGHTRALGPVIEGSNITAFYLRPAYAFEDEHIWEHHFWIVPITSKELDFLHEKGPNALEDHLEENEVDILNLLREDSF
jgi:hypothetical protein